MKRAASKRRSGSWSKSQAPRGLALLLGFGVLASPSWATDARDPVPPRPIDRSTPSYPEDLYKAGIEGDADIAFEVDETGKTQNPVIRFATHPEFGQAAADAVVNWRFQPGLRQGKPARFRVAVPFNFRMPTVDPLSRWAGRNVFRSVETAPVEAASLESWPQPARWIYPPYPNELRGSGKRGSVVVQFVVDEYGEVINPEVLQSDDPRFVASALATAISLRFPPHLTPDGVAVPVQMALLFRFDERRQKMWDQALTPKRIR